MASRSQLHILHGSVCQPMDQPSVWVSQRILARNTPWRWRLPHAWRVLSNTNHTDHHSTGAYAPGNTPYHRG
jgi:hypothetical protein